MTDYETILYVEKESVARILLTALRAHGFTPRDIPDGGLPGIRTGLSDGIAIDVPEDQASDAKPLAQALLADMDSSKAP
ncbi:hypothetical protein [Pelagibacterium xiamenense]|uniref:hypothetical protein n=1 Tax=Pelagibacterium xiamenense TaxID=2901140 RepID=UPI001E543691|nr:hypothetical protein [Pelagibacterium xiamenense]MCD7058276.1 hypothetical protein [Pelagibacterium xiamenense]